MLNDLTLLFFDNATDSGRDIRQGRRQRRDGWTPDRIKTFLHTLALTGVVARAARAVGISAKSAYALRNSAKGQAFARAWALACSAARKRLAVPAVSRLHGVVEPIMRRGKLWGLHHRFDNPYAMRTLTRLDRMAAKQPPDAALLRVAENFDAFVDYVCDRVGGPAGSSDRYLYRA